MGFFAQKNGRKFSGLWGSLATRIFVIALCFLVIPLILLGVLTYVRDYKEDFGDLFTQLKLLGRGRAAILNQFNHLEYRFLDMTDELFRLKAQQPGVTEGEMNHFLAGIKKEQNVSSIFVLQKEGPSKWICSYSSNPQMVGKDYSSYIDKRALSQEHAATIRYDPETDKGYYFVSKRIYSPGNARVENMLNIALSSKDLLERIEIIRKKDDPTEVSLLDPSGMIFISTNPILTLNQIVFPGQTNEPFVTPKHRIPIQPIDVNVEGPPDNFTFEIEGHKENAVVLPIEASDVRIMVSVPSRYFLRHFADYMVDLAAMLLFVIIVGGVGAFWLTFRMSKPFSVLCGIIEKVEEGDLHARFEEQKMGFEINIVGEYFNNAMDSLIKHMHAAENERVAKETLAKELSIGREVQKSILPKQVPAFSDFEIASGFIAAKEVGGDFYDLFVVQKESDDHLMCAMADTAGKGISACFYSLGLRSMLRSYGATSAPLKDVLVQTNNVFCHDTGETGVFVTAWVGYLNEKTKQLTYSSCGHPPALLKRAQGAIEKLSTPGIALGATHLDHVPTEQIQLASGDVLLMYTDGITEAHNDKNELYGESKLEEYLKTHSCDTAQKVIDDLLIDIGQFTTGVAQFDDMTLLVIKVL